MTSDPDDVMNIGNRLLKQYPDAFSTEFSANKEVVQNMTYVSSNRLRNRIAGYITRQKQSH
ncbi:30S ribosomal protein S17e [Natrinema halophilum]|uniref:30S ribosomal protein S17e n=1 Tax=Natrinema halophilum TaxID=1699371 RepID=UPI001F308479|nr:30S ribosomal protein S17e [Natrinema halophilum]UHQ96158.1 30S ribosomal protein S17e [Natrinema halophilum]